MTKLQSDIALRILKHENQKEVALSGKYPALQQPIILVRHRMRATQNLLDFRLQYSKKNEYFNCVVARHQSVLRRKLGNSNPKLQENKIINLKQAVKQLNGVIIQPNHVFSFWNIIGKPEYTRGYVDGMLLSNGKVIEGVGGGLCQLSNFLYWIFLHAPIETVERHHHSLDVFPDSGRTLPFGGGATVLYNFIDLKIQNISSQPLQLKIWLTDAYLKGQILSPFPVAEKCHLIERNHYFVKRGNHYFRYNEIYKETKVKGAVERYKKIATNFAPVLYDVTDDYLSQNNFEVIDFTYQELQ